MQDQSSPFLPADQVRARYGVSDMTIWRWMRSPDIQFPKPALRPSNRCRLWKLSDLQAWEESRAEQVEA